MTARVSVALIAGAVATLAGSDPCAAQAPRRRPAQHRADVPRQPRLGRGRRLRQRARRADAEHRQHRRPGHPPRQLQRRVLVHRLARGAAHGPLRHPLRGDAADRHHAVGGHDRRAAQGRRLRDGAVRQVAPRRHELDRGPHADRPGVRRVVRHPEHQQRGADRRRARASTPRTTEAPYIWEQKAGGAGDEGQGVRPRLAAHARSRGGAQERGLHGAERRGRASRSSSSIRSRRSTSPRSRIPDFAGKTGAGDIGDAMADVDYNVGLILAGARSDSASSATRWCSGARTTAPRAVVPGAAAPVRGAASTTR